MKQAIIIILSLCSTLNALSEDFGHRYGANSRLLQRTLYFKDSTKKKCQKAHARNNCCTHVSQSANTN